jgi:hypothetical protein
MGWGWVRSLLLVVVVGVPSCLAAELHIVNTSGKAIHELYLAMPGQRSWGADLLRDKQPRFIGRGETHVVADIAPGDYQLMLVDADGSECEIDSLAITATHRLDLTAAKLRECTSSH